ncbi:MAG TPA: translation initiation factor IF-2 subunit beta [Candidatus Nanoarchaeia archaeon]|nr:translation initiation factor IF-2 subunit beta [Candidatus Nanoarchaeia archaeon]
MGDYEANLDRALEMLPDIETSDERFIIPEPKIFSEGKATVLENFSQIVDVLNREPDHVMKALTRELGTAGKIDGQHAVFQGKFTSEAIAEQIESYVNEYVKCSECGRPDTKLIKSDRILMLQCDACGAHRPVRKRKASIEAKKDALEEGETYEFKIESIGSKGDGIAKVDKYIVYIIGASKKEVVKAKVKRISGTVVFADLV